MELRFLCFVLFCIQPFISTGQVEQYIKDKILNNYLHYLAFKSEPLERLDSDGFHNIVVPSGFTPTLTLERLRDSLQFLSNEGIELYLYSGLGLAFRVKANNRPDSLSTPYIIEKGGSLLRSGFIPHSGLVGYSKEYSRVFYFSGPLILHDAKYLTINRSLSVENIQRYIFLKYFDQNIADIQIDNIESNVYLSKITLHADSTFQLVFHKDILTSEISVY